MADRIGKVVKGLQTSNASWHSIHSGQTVDEAISGYDTLVQNIAELNSWVQALDELTTQLKNQLSLKYDKIGGPIGEKGVQITGGTSPNNSKLTVRFIDGVSAESGDLNHLYLNGISSSNGNIYFCSGPSSSKKAYITREGKVFGAVWNDFAEFRKSDETEAGRVVCENGDGSLSRSYKRLQPGAMVVSDTYGFAIGETDECQTPVAVAGRVLAYPYEDWWCFEPGQPVCAGPNGTVSMMSRREARKYPDRIIGTVSELPTYETWGKHNTQVNGRIWIKMR